MLCVIDLMSDVMDLSFDALVKLIGELEIIRLFAESYDFFCKGLAAFAALCPYFGKSYVYAEFLTFCFNEVEFCLGVCRESIDSYAAGKAEYVLDVADMLKEVRKTASSASRFSLLSSAFGTPP